MRPSTLAEACRRIEAGIAQEIALGDFLQAFYTIEARGAMLAQEPALAVDIRFNALVGGSSNIFSNVGHQITHRIGLAIRAVTSTSPGFPMATKIQAYGNI